jgi:hypothetical protein
MPEARVELARGCPRWILRLMATRAHSGGLGSPPLHSSWPHAPLDPARAAPVPQFATQ